MVVFFYPNFLWVSEQKRVVDSLGPSYQVTEYYQQIITECKETLILLLSGTILLIRGVRVTIYGVTSKKERSGEIIKKVNLDTYA